MKPGWKAPAQQALALWVEYVLFPHSHPEDLSGATWNRKTGGKVDFMDLQMLEVVWLDFKDTGYRDVEQDHVEKLVRPPTVKAVRKFQELPAMSPEIHFGQATFGGSCVWTGCPGGWQGRHMNRGVELGETYSNLGWNEKVFIDLACTSRCCKIKSHFSSHQTKSCCCWILTKTESKYLLTAPNEPFLQLPNQSISQHMA